MLLVEEVRAFPLACLWLRLVRERANCVTLGFRTYSEARWSHTAHFCQQAGRSGSSFSRRDQRRESNLCPSVVGVLPQLQVGL